MKKRTIRRYKNITIHQSFDMRTQSNEEQKDDMWSIISNITQLLGLAIPISILIGSIAIYSYLNKLGAISLLHEIISTSTYLISIMITYIVIIVFIFLTMYIIYYFSIRMSNEILKSENNINIDIWEYYLIPGLVYLFLLKVCTFPENINTNILLYSGIIILLSVIISYYLYRKINNKSFCILFYLIYAMLLSSFVSYIIVLSIYNFTFWFLSTWFNKPIISFIISSIICYFILNYLKNLKSQGTKILLIMIASSVLLLIIPNSKISSYLFGILSYVEKPADARWYLLDTRFINQYGLVKKEGTTGLNDKDTLIEWQKKFSANDDSDDKIDKNSTTYKNAVYGYMAWNLGKTKIFCPHDVTIENEKTLDKVCLTINGDYLQPIPDDL